jgi:regulator of G-protein signaling
MAARIRASFTDDDSISDHLTLEMVRLNAPQTTSTTTNNDPDEQVTLNESAGTTGGSTAATNDFLSTSNPGLTEGINREYEIPNLFTYKKIESLLERMQDEKTGLSIKSVKSFMSKIPSVLTGGDLIQWILKTLDVDDTTEALHLTNLMSSHGYILPIDDHVLTVKNDGTFYRFQTPYFWPSNHSEADNTDYAVYLCKRTMQNKTRLELADYEAENLARLQKLFARKWEFIYMQAEAQIKVDKKRDKFERNVLDSQERAFWDVYRPAPGCINTTEQDIKKLMRRKTTYLTPRLLIDAYRKSSTVSTTNTAPASALAFAANRNLITMTVGLLTTGPMTTNTSQSHSSNQNRESILRECDEDLLIEQLYQEIEFLKHRIDRPCLKTSKVREHYVSHFEQYAEFDPFMTLCEPSNPWITDSTDLWELEKVGTSKDISSRRIKRWSFSINELLKDPIGRDYFLKFLDKEYSSENLRFYEACIQLRFHTPQKDVLNRVKEIYNEFLSPGAYYSINIDQRVMNFTKNNMVNLANRYTFDEAQDHIFNLMNRDTYARFLRSETYKELLIGGKKKFGIKSGRLSIVIRNPTENLSVSSTNLTGGNNDKHLLGTSPR